MFEFLKDQVDARIGLPIGVSGSEHRYKCPECPQRGEGPDTKGKLHINYEKGVLNCFRCNYRGTLNKLAKKLGIAFSRPPSDWSAAARKGFMSYGKSVVDDSYDNTLELEYPCDVQPVIAGSPAYSYLSSRGFNQGMIDYYRIVQGTGNRWYHRIFVPTLHDDEVVYWVARTIKPDIQPKYLTPKDIDKKHYIYNMDKASKFNSVVITEGVFDAIAVGSNAVSLFGKTASKEQRVMLSNGSFDSYVVCLDSDASKEAFELMSWLESQGKSVYYVAMPSGVDPATDRDIDKRIREAVPFRFANLARTRLISDDNT